MKGGVFAVRLCKQLGLLLTAVMLLLFLSGVSARAETETFYTNAYGNIYPDNKEGCSALTLNWSVSNLDITVQTAATWNPQNLCYDVTSVTDVTFCQPQMNIAITNHNPSRYCLATATVIPANGFSLNASVNSFSRNEVKMEDDEIVCGQVDAKNYPYEDTITEVLSVSNTNGIITIGPWYTAAKRDYYIVLLGEGDYGDNLGTSALTFTLTLSNPQLISSLTDLNNWSGSTYNGGNSIKIADVTITLKMVEIPSEFKVTQ